MWADESVFYHIYPIGFCGAPSFNNFVSEPRFRLSKVYDWVPHLKQLGVNAIYFGPLMESSSHGYDTKDYFMVDRRLGSNEDLKKLVSHLHQNGIRVVIDGVFNHVGRDFFAFEDVKQSVSYSKYCSWFKLNFNSNNHYDDGFCYEGWDGCDDLIKLVLTNPEVKNHIFAAVLKWIDEFDIDGLRLDVAHYLPLRFLHELKQICLQRKKDFWLMGEMVFGNYCRLVNSHALDSCTNYELYKGLHSSCNNRNMFELSHTLDRQFGNRGIYNGVNLYNFLDNHDVSYISSKIKDSKQIKVLYALLFTLPGIPSIYYGSEWGQKGVRSRSDSEVRPYFLSPKDNDISLHISWWAKYRQNNKALCYGGYQELETRRDLLVFRREYKGQHIDFAANIGNETQKVLHLEQEKLINPYEMVILSQNNMQKS